MVVTYSGTSEHGLDDKGRLTLPARILDQVAKAQWRFYLTASLDPCLLLHDQQGWEDLVARIGKGVPGSPAHRNLCRRFLGNSEEVVPDGQRRIRIPEPLLQYAGLGASKPMVLLGMGRVLELWSPDRLGKVMEVASPEEEALFASLVDPRTPSAPVGA
ncbi:MAG: division/cell wall cluster transcriptional repressor MraZ [Planctomycetota bacterium]